MRERGERPGLDTLYGMPMYEVGMCGIMDSEGGASAEGGDGGWEGAGCASCLMRCVLEGEDSFFVKGGIWGVGGVGWMGLKCVLRCHCSVWPLYEA